MKSAGVFYKRRSQFGSLARFRVTLMVQYLMRQCGVHYNPDRIKDPVNFDDPEDSFIHGLLGPRRSGTCASLPVLITAVGRRIGYPLKLVLAPCHCFFRWDSFDERFNIEYHPNGLNFHPDSFYEEWPFKWNQQLYERERTNPMFLQSLTPTQELAFCARNRTSQLDVAGRRNEAVASMKVAHRLWPTEANAIWVTHLATKALFPNRQFPRAPCQETAGEAAAERLNRRQTTVFSIRTIR